MEPVYRSRLKLLFLILICSTCGLSFDNGQYKTDIQRIKCCDDDHNLNQIQNDSAAAYPNTNNNSLVSKRYQSNWLATSINPNSTCIRILLTESEKKEANQRSKQYGSALYCSDVTINIVDNYQKLSRDMKTVFVNGSSIDHNYHFDDTGQVFNAIILTSIRLNDNYLNARDGPSTHSFDNAHSFDNKIHRDRLVINENKTEYLSWRKSDLTTKQFSEWMQLQHHFNQNNAFERLNHLDLSANRLMNLTWEMFENVPNLKILNLSWNAIDTEHISHSLFHRIIQLQLLDLSHNHLKSIVKNNNNYNKNSYDQDQDQFLYPASGESMKYVNSMPSNGFIVNHTELRELDLSYNQITDLPRNTFIVNGLPKLCRLNLNHNRLTIIPFQIFNSLTALEDLDMSSNRLVLFLDNFFIGHSALKKLNLRNNTIEQITKNSFYDLKNLRELDLSENHLINIDRNAFDSLDALLWLDLQQNNLTNLPTTLFYHQKQLRYLNLSKNKFKILPNGIFSNQFALEILYIDETAIEKLTNWISRNVDVINKDILHRLRFLSIRNNHQLREIESITYRNLPSIEYLNLTRNSLTTLPQEIAELTELKHLDISNNDLISIPKQLHALQKLESIDMLGNSYVCDCQMVWLTEWINETRTRLLLNNNNNNNRRADSLRAPFNQLNYLKCRHGYPGDFLRVLQQLQCIKPEAINVTESKTYLLSSDAQLECSFAGSPVPDVIWVTPLNKIIRFYSDPDAKPLTLNYLTTAGHNSSTGHSDSINADLEHHVKYREKIESQILKRKQINFTAATVANGVTLLENGALRVHNISRKDSGLYVCYGYNVMGFTSAEIRFVLLLQLS